MDPGFSEVTLYTPELFGTGLENSHDQIEGIRDQLFNEFGLIVPPIHVQADRALVGNSFQLRVNRQRLGAFSAETDTLLQRIAALLREQRAELLKPDLVDCYLMRLAASHPALVAIVRRRFDLDSLAQALRRRLQAQVSIKDLTGTLEALLLESLVQP
jgi:flagellar biosynthesis component FlhA